MLTTASRTTKRFLTDQSGASAIEYGLMAVLFVIICMAVIQFFGVSLDSVHGDVADALTDAADNS